MALADNGQGVNWIVVIARNNLALTKKAVASFLKQDIPVQVLVINNASTDGTAEWLHSQPVYNIHYQGQKSVAECWNRALRLCFKDGAEHVLVVNNDTELKPWTYRMLLEDGGGFVTAVGVNTREQFDQEPDPTKRRDNPDFSAFFIRKEVFARVQFDEAYKGGYVEDAQFHLDLFRAGIPAYCIGVPFFHVASGTLKASDPDEQERIRAYADANRKLFRERHGVDVGTPGYYALFAPLACTGSPNEVENGIRDIAKQD